MRKQRITVSVIGGHEPNDKVEQICHDVGFYIAEMDCVCVCGGLDGVMKAVSRGVKAGGGLTIGLLPGTEKTDANEFIDIALPTSFGFARNAMVACSADIIVAMPGSYGTESEICYGLVYKRPVIDLGGWGMRGMLPAADVDEAKAHIKTLVDGLRLGA